MDYYKLFDLLAGVLALKLRFSNEYLISKINFISEVCLYSERYTTRLNSHPTTEIDLLNVGYDEILLLELFEPLITLNNYILEMDEKKKEQLNHILEEGGEENANKFKIDHFVNLKNQMLSLFVLIENSDDTILFYEKIYFNPLRLIIDENFIEKISGEKINMLGEKSRYTLEEITSQEYKTRALELVRQIIESKFGHESHNNKVKDLYPFVLDYLIDLAYKPEYLLREFTNYYFNIGVNLLNKKFFALLDYLAIDKYYEGSIFSDIAVNYYANDFERLNNLFTDIYPRSNVLPSFNYKLKYLKYKQKYLILKNKQSNKKIDNF